MTKREALAKVRAAEAMNELPWPMTAEAIRLRPVIVRDMRRVRETGSYKREGSEK